MLDKGLDYSNNDVHSFSYNEMRKMYKHGGLSLSIGKQIINYVEGSCVGGGSEINSGLYHKTPKNILIKWTNEFSLIGSDYSKLLKHYTDIEKRLCVSFYPKGKVPLASLKLTQGADNLGWDVHEIPRWFKYKNNGSAAGVKMTMSQTYIRDYLLNGGLILSGCSVTRLRKTKNHWKVQIDYNRQKHNIMSKNVILSAGAIGTPLILRRSGLSKLSGNNLQMHPTIKVVALFNEQVNSVGMGVPVHQVKEFSPDFTFGCSISTPPYLRIAMLDHNENIDLVDKNWKQMAIYYASIIPQGTGTVRKVPFFKDPLVRYKLTQIDRQTLALALKKLCELLLSAGALELFPSIHNGPVIKDMNDLKALPNKIISSRTSLMTVHLFSSCPMGEDKDICVVDSYGKVHGQENLWVSDASMIPSAPGVNPQGTIMAFAHRNVEKIITEA
jgi:choline dehydrogenase-like flavoprotein